MAGHSGGVVQIVNDGKQRWGKGGCRHAVVIIGSPASLNLTHAVFDTKFVSLNVTLSQYKWTSLVVQAAKTA